MPQELLNILIQLPIVAIFIWYADRTTTRFQDFLREERKTREDQNQRMVEKLDVQTRQIIALQGLITDHATQLTDIMPKLRDALYSGQKE